MLTVPITLPRELLIFVESQVTARGLTSPSEYLQALVVEALKQKEQAELEVRFATAIRALERGEANPLSPADWQRLRQCALSCGATPDGKP